MRVRHYFPMILSVVVVSISFVLLSQYFGISTFILPNIMAFLTPPSALDHLIAHAKHESPVKTFSHASTINQEKVNHITALFHATITKATKEVELSNPDLITQFAIVHGGKVNVLT